MCEEIIKDVIGHDEVKADETKEKWGKWRSQLSSITYQREVQEGEQQVQ